MKKLEGFTDRQKKLIIALLENTRDTDTDARATIARAALETIGKPEFKMFTLEVRSNEGTDRAPVQSALMAAARAVVKEGHKALLYSDDFFRGPEAIDFEKDIPNT